MTEDFEGYFLRTRCGRRSDGRYGVAVLIETSVGGVVRREKFIDRAVSFTLEVEAEKEAINFGKNLIRRKMNR